MRLFNIQRVIMERVGFERAPNVSAMHEQISSSAAEHRLRSTMQRRQSRRDDDAQLPANYLAQRVITLLPVCKYGMVRHGKCRFIQRYYHESL